MMEVLKKALSTFKRRTDLDDFGGFLTKSSIGTFVLSVIAVIPVIFMGLGYGFSQSPAKELTPFSAVIVLVTLVTSSVTLVTTRRFCIVTKGSITILLWLELTFCLIGIVLGITMSPPGKSCKGKLSSMAIPLPWKTPRPECNGVEPMVDVDEYARFLLASVMFVWFLHILVLSVTLIRHCRQAKKSETEVVNV